MVNAEVTCGFCDRHSLPSTGAHCVNYSDIAIFDAMFWQPVAARVADAVVSPIVTLAAPRAAANAVWADLGRDQIL